MMTSRFSSCSRWMLSRAGPDLVPQTIDMAWRSCARTAARNRSTAARGVGAPGSAFAPAAPFPEEADLQAAAAASAMMAPTILLYGTLSPLLRM